jgi:3-oxoacyl-[acyl-carrier protein] reductase
MDLGIEGRHAIVLGGSSGLGFGIARALAGEGARVTIAARDKVKMDTAAADITSATGRAVMGYSLDLASAVSLTRFKAEVPNAGILVLNGGGPPPGPVADVTTAMWLEHFQRMFLALTELGLHHLPGMKAERWGRLLVVASSGVLQPIPNLGISNTLRLALIGWAKTLAREVAPYGVTVNCIAPGRIDTDRVRTLDSSAARTQGIDVETVRTRSISGIPVGRYGSVDEFGSVAAFLASDRASYVTGSVHRVDGGMVAGV